jgi:predicted RNA-binding Zn-ribbon protein involved in translation (DUF1610 family)
MEWLRAYRGDGWQCPKCGSALGVRYSVRVNGWRNWSWSPDTGTEMTDDDNMRETLPKTVTCENCGKRIPRPEGVE